MKKLVIRNLKDFFEIDFDNQFQVLGELEKKLNGTNNVLTTIDVKVNDNVFAIFDLIKIEYSKKTIFTYHYSTSAS